MPTPRKKTAASPAKKIDVNVEVERKLIDTKIIMPEEPATHRFLKIVVYAVILGGLLGAGAVFYLKISRYEPETSYIPEITVPQEKSQVNDSSAGTASTTTADEITPSAAEPVQVAEILETPTGTLNVRKGPGTNFAKIATVKPGEAFILISTDEKAGWYEIKLADGTAGWVTKQYAAVR